VCSSQITGGGKSHSDVDNFIIGKTCHMKELIHKSESQRLSLSFDMPQIIFAFLFEL